MPGRSGLKNATGAICLCVLCAIAVAGLWPFDPFPRNDVSWLENQNGLHFGPAGVAYSLSDFQWADSPGREACSLELWLRPDRNNGVNDILTFYSPEAPQRLRLFKWRNSTLLLYSDFRSQHREIDVDDAFHPGTPLLITITAGSHSTSVYLNGTLARTSTRLTLSRSDFAGQLVLGTSAVTNNPWSGQLRGIAFYDQELTGVQVSRSFTAWSGGGRPAAEADGNPVALYTFGERAGRLVHDQIGAAPDLCVPENYRIPHKALLLAPWKDFRRNWSTLQDVATNVAGFIFLGFFLQAYLVLQSGTKWPALVTLFSGAAISLAVEILQVYLPTRASSMTDVLMNTLGTALGILLCKSVRTFFARKETVSTAW
jgi:VanZ like family/Concanavalin A-like lectin/glucanases superfamily